MFTLARPRRNRQSKGIRELIKETHLCPQDFILPLFLMEGKNLSQPIDSFPGQFLYSLDQALKKAEEAQELGLSGLMLFPKLDSSLKDPSAKESYKDQGLLQRGIQRLKKSFPDMTLFSDVAMDPYSSDGHDGLVKNGKILNDETLEILAGMSLSQARAGTDFIAPSDMMDGRIQFLREKLDENGFKDVGILSYSAKYASSLYGPFRKALDSEPRFHKNHSQSLSDKKTYQMDPSNIREALREIALDEKEGADIVMIKPALFYLDVIRAAREATNLPLAAYLVSGEESMIRIAGQREGFDEKAILLEALIGIKRAGANIIVCYGALEIARLLSG